MTIAKKKKPNGKACRDKGVAGELDARNFLRDHFPGASEAERSGNQYRGGEVAPDVTGVPGFWVEVKRRATDAPQVAHLKKATAEAEPTGAVPIVLHRKDYEPRWAVTMWGEDLARLLHVQKMLAV